MEIIETIIPIFAVITLGAFACWRGFIRPEFLNPANRLVYYLAIPAMIFRAISKASLKGQFNVQALSIVLLSVAMVFGLAWLTAALLRIRNSQRGTFVQSASHANIGYIGLAVAFYYLGTEGLVRASIMAGFLLILQNLLAVIALQVYSTRSHPGGNGVRIVWKILGNPVILAAIAGILFSLADIGVPEIIARSLDILSSMALPMALLIIGASLSFKMMQNQVTLILATTIFKLLLLPAVGLAGFHLLHTSPQDYLPGLILLASPTATLTYVMAKEIGGDPDLAVSTISINTMLSAVTFTLWLKVAG